MSPLPLFGTVRRGKLTLLFVYSTKESVKLQLPRKIDNIVLCPLTATQKEAYRNIMQLPDVQLLLTADDPCPCGAVDSNEVRYKQGKCCEQEWSKLIFKVRRASFVASRLDSSLCWLLTVHGPFPQDLQPPRPHLPR